MAGVIGTAILRTQTDERLVGLARAGHERAFEAIAERYRGELTRALRRILPSAAVEDALQQTHLQAWQALTGGTEVRELRAWLHRIARNAAIAAASRGYDYDELKDALLVSAGPEEDLERRDAVRRALRGIAELPERQRDALLAVAVEGRSHAEVALDLGITDTAARQLVRRARVSLIGLMSVAMPPQVILWAARAGHSVVAGKAAAGSKAAAGKAAAGTGLGGGVGGAAMKVGVIAVTVGGVAAGVPPIRHVLVPSRPPSHHHGLDVEGGRPGYVTGAVTTAALRGAGSRAKPSGGSSSAGASSGGGAAAAARRRRAARDAKSVIVAPVATAPAPAAPAVAAPAAAGVSSTPTAGGPTTVAAATPAAQAAAALWAWWAAQREHQPGSSVGSQKTSTAGRQTGPQQSGASSSVDHSQATGCGSTGPTGPAGAIGTTGTTGTTSRAASGSAAPSSSGVMGTSTSTPGQGGSSGGAGANATTQGPGAGFGRRAQGDGSAACG